VWRTDGQTVAKYALTLCIASCGKTHVYGQQAGDIRRIFMPPQSHGRRRLSRCHYVPLSWCLVSTSAFFHFAQILNGFRWSLREVIITINRWTHYISGEIVYQGQGRMKMRIDAKPLLLFSEWLHKFHSTYGTLRRCVRRAGESVAHMQRRSLGV